MKKQIILSLSILLVISNCNIFEWTTSSDEDAFYEGLKLFNQKKFTEAREKFAEALEADPNRSDYLYYHAKATVFEAELDYFTIGRHIIEIDTTHFTDWRLPLYTREPDMTVEQDIAYKDTIYQVTQISHDDISSIYFNKTHGDIKPNDIYFEFSILSIARAILQLRDTNNDKVIDQNDIYFKITKAYNPITGNYVYFPNLGEIYDYLIFSEDNVAGFNQMLSNCAVYSIEGIAALTNTFTDTTYLDNEDLEEIVKNVEDMSNLYQVADGKDNDGDGEIDEEALNGWDDDNDGYIDEDTHL